MGLLYFRQHTCNNPLKSRHFLSSRFGGLQSKYNFDSIELWLNKEDLISKVLISDPTAGKTEILFSDYELNQNLADSEFSFVPPEGSKVIDFR